MSRHLTPDQEVVVYVGTHRLVAMLGTVAADEPRILKCVELKNPAGFRRGLVTSLEHACLSLEEILDELLPGVGLSELSLFVVLGNAKLRSYRFTSSCYYQGFRRTITAHEVQNVIQQTRSVATLPLDEFVLQAIPESFIVNDLSDIPNPLGMEAQRLGVWLNIFTMKFEDFKNLSRVFETTESEVKGYFPKTLILAESVLSEEEKEQGAVVIDIADDVTQLILCKSSCLIATRPVPLGSERLTQAIAEAYGIEPHDAERVKEHFATLDTDRSQQEELVPLGDRKGKTNHHVKRQDFQDKFVAEAKKWLSDLLGEVEQLGREERVLFPHYVFTGGGTQIDGFLEFLQREFAVEGRIGRVRRVDAATEILVDPSLTAPVGVYRWLVTQERSRDRMLAPRGFLQKTLTYARNWFAHYF